MHYGSFYSVFEMKREQYDWTVCAGRLRGMLSAEEDQYLTEMAAAEETTLERQAKMREKAKALKERREAERRAFVEEKLEQQFRLDFKPKSLP